MRCILIVPLVIASRSKAKPKGLPITVICDGSLLPDPTSMFALDMPTGCHRTCMYVASLCMYVPLL